MSSDEFWVEDAHRLAEIEQERKTGIRMPQKAVERSEPAVVYRTAAAKSLPWSLISGILAVIALSAAAGWYVYSWPVITSEEFDQLTAGMTLEECEAIVGAKSSSTVVFDMPLPKTAEFNVSSATWVNQDDSGAAVSFVNEKLAVKLFVSVDGNRKAVVW